MDPYRPEQWHDFFLMMGGGAAALTGLVFVAMSLHLEAIVLDPLHRHRARSALTGLTAVFMRCGLVLMGGQSGRAVAVEIFLVCALITGAGIRSFWPFWWRSGPGPAVPAGSVFRTIGATCCYLLEMAGAVVLFAGFALGLYLIGLAMVSIFFFAISGSWLLLVGVSRAAPEGSVRAGPDVDPA